MGLLHLRRDGRQREGRGGVRERGRRRRRGRRGREVHGCGQEVERAAVEGERDLDLGLFRGALDEGGAGGEGGRWHGWRWGGGDGEVSGGVGGMGTVV